MTPTRKRLLIGLCVAAGTAVALALYLPGLRPHPAPPAVVSTGEAKIGGPFNLTDGSGKRVTEALLRDRYSLLYFGFTHCPDICPLALGTITEALEIAGPQAETVLPIFVTVDPERDTPQVMADYVANFHPRFVALTGTPDEIRATTAVYRVYAAKAAGTAPEEYNMAHSDFIYLIGPDGKYVTHFRAEDTALDIANRLRREMRPK
jgi:protein SCO1/2